jgi:hypothetical protein
MKQRPLKYGNRQILLEWTVFRPYWIIKLDGSILFDPNNETVKFYQKSSVPAELHAKAFVDKLRQDEV